MSFHDRLRKLEQQAGRGDGHDGQAMHANMKLILGSAEAFAAAERINQHVHEHGMNAVPTPLIVALQDAMNNNAGDGKRI